MRTFGGCVDTRTGLAGLGFAFVAGLAFAAGLPFTTGLAFAARVFTTGLDDPRVRPAVMAPA
ncbi:MAG: hypothetical protein JNK64_41985 [Myxococcales bacterium]|nr:hypothetical protein [Myxococcales bacterium]